MSHRRRRQAPPQKRALFTNTIESRPSAQPTIEVPQCAWCSMRSVTTCELPNCRKGLCARHVIRKAGGSLCPNHGGALLVQYDGFVIEDFGDRGEAYAAKI
jgi:hypothetical protein